MAASSNNRESVGSGGSAPGRLALVRLASEPAKEQGATATTIADKGQPVDPLPPSTFSPRIAKTLDRTLNVYMANFIGGVDRRVIPLAYLGWLTHPRLTEKALRKAVLLGL